MTYPSQCAEGVVLDLLAQRLQGCLHSSRSGFRGLALGVTDDHTGGHDGIKRANTLVASTIALRATSAR